MLLGLGVQSGVVVGSIRNWTLRIPIDRTGEANESKLTSSGSMVQVKAFTW
jgi:hypothetical protein